ncbi:MAG: MATE family efflux transporter [Pseudomonadota bacterium]
MSDDSTPAPPPLADPSWAGHIQATLRLGLPLIAAQLGQQAITVTDTIMLGWLGAAELAAGVLATSLFFVAFIACSGFAHAVMPLAAAAEGRGDPRGVRRSVRMGLWLVTAVVTLLMPVLWYTELLLLAAAQDPKLASFAQEYMRIAQWALYPAVWLVVLRSYFSALERAGIVMWAMFGGVLLNAVLDWMFIFGNWGAPAMGIEGAAIATLGTAIITCVPLVVAAFWMEISRKYEIFVRFWRPDWAAIAELLRLGAPISGTLLAEVGLFVMASMMLGWLGTIALAAHGIALQVTSVVFMIPLGLSAAATARVGRAVGRRDRLGLNRAAVTVMTMAVGFAAAAAVVLWVVPEPLIELFLDDEEPAALQILATGAGLLAVAAVFQLVDALQVVSVALLRGLKDTKWPMLIAIASYWGLGVPSAYFLGFVMEFGGQGVWAGLAIGLTAAAVLLTWRFMRRDALGLVVPA